MEEKIEIKELCGKLSGLLYRYNITFSINKELTKVARENLYKKIDNIISSNYYPGLVDIKLKYEISIVSAKEYYINQLNKIIYVWWTNDSNYPDYIDENDIKFLDSLFPRFIKNQSIYSPGTIVIIDTFNNISNSKNEIKNEIISICKQF